MKLIDYYCTICGKERNDYPDGKKPPVCCRKIMLKKYHPTPVVFKGEGWTNAGKEKRD